MKSKLNRMKELVEQLNKASQAYYAEDKEIISNFEYDKLYEELETLETELNTVLANSPTLKVGYEAVDELPKEAHDKPMLSLGKTKERLELQSWLMEKEGLLSWKLDGLTIVLTYQEGVLKKAVTRGNGEVGEVVTNNAKVFKNIPLKIPFQGELIIRGEAVIRYSDFEKINSEIEEVGAKYKNPRNLCSGSVRQLNNEVTAKRYVYFYAFALVSKSEQGADLFALHEEEFEFLLSQGFSIVDYVKVTKDTVLNEIENFAQKVQQYDIPSDGLVLTFNDIAYGKSLGMTAKFPRDSIAFKWTDEQKETNLIEIEWSPSRTGLINPVAIFEPVELEGTTVSRASVHNISIMKQLELGIGDTITVYKANMIIPQIAENITKSNGISIPDTCPVCGGKTEIRKLNEVEALYCTNGECDAKKIKSFTHFVGRNALNIDGLSEATLEKMIAMGFIHEYADIFHLSQHRDSIVLMEGFGEKSYQNLVRSIEAARKTSLPAFLYSLGIPNVGVANAKMICKEFQYDLDSIRNAGLEDLASIDGIGEVIAKSIVDYFIEESNAIKIDHLLSEIEFEAVIVNANANVLEGITFVITGSLERFENRDSLKEIIENMGGKVTGSVTKKTSYLINNDNLSTSSKNKKAKELGIPIITEEEFIEQFQ